MTSLALPPSRRVALSSVIAGAAAEAVGGGGGGARRSYCSALVRAASDMFLPVGFPSTVGETYLRFQVLDSIQGLSSYLRGILATQALFTGMGVGDDASTALAATLQWVTRDGASMLGSLLFAWLGATSFDRNVRQWRLFADLINDFGLTVEMLAPMAKALSPALFVPTMCVASVAKALCGVAAGATRATISLHFARADNLADLCAKEGTQETAVTLIGLLCGMAFAKAVNSQPLAIWIAFALLTLLHVVANIGAVRCLHLGTINALRWEILAAAWARGGGAAGGAAAGDGVAAALPTPAAVAAEEPLLLPLRELSCGRLGACGGRRRCELGCSPAALATLNAVAVAEAVAAAEQCGLRYAIVASETRVAVLLHDDASAIDVFHSQYACALRGSMPRASNDDRATCARVDADAARFLSALRERGWDTARCLLRTAPWRQSWEVKVKRG